MTTTHLTQKDFKFLWNQLKNSAAARGIPFDLTPLDIDDIGIPINCPVLGIPLAFNRGKVQDNSISFDRIDSSRGYTKGNVVVISYRANKLKSDATLTELQKLAQFYTNLDDVLVLHSV